MKISIDCTPNEIDELSRRAGGAPPPAGHVSQPKTPATPEQIQDMLLLALQQACYTELVKIVAEAQSVEISKTLAVELAQRVIRMISTHAGVLLIPGRAPPEVHVSRTVPPMSPDDDASLEQFLVDAAARGE